MTLLKRMRCMPATASDVCALTAITTSAATIMNCSCNGCSGSWPYMLQGICVWPSKYGIGGLTACKSRMPPQTARASEDMQRQQQPEPCMQHAASSVSQSNSLSSGWSRYQCKTAVWIHSVAARGSDTARQGALAEHGFSLTMLC